MTKKNKPAYEAILGIEERGDNRNPVIFQTSKKYGGWTLETVKANGYKVLFTGCQGDCQKEQSAFMKSWDNAHPGWREDMHKQIKRDLATWCKPTKLPRASITMLGSLLNKEKEGWELLGVTGAAK